ncbi:MAG: type II secretion system GspH family protein [Gammaproteobacteria bacterium]|nr:type II secretion system GspH family protein [Gammaproteobacteria bacterium]MBU2479092.1 type II secretion system GspH family protein [Gammaproteobacteria bacterium]
MNKQTGFTLIELVMVIVIIGILAAMAVPRFVNLQGDALLAAKQGTLGAVRSAFAISIAQQKGYPTVEQLAANVQGSGGTAANPADTGVEVSINSATYTVLTFQDGACTTANTAALRQVQCIGNITP